VTDAKRERGEEWQGEKAGREREEEEEKETETRVSSLEEEDQAKKERKRKSFGAGRFSGTHRIHTRKGEDTNRKKKKQAPL